MYLEYYDLKEKPFAITPDPDFIYLNDTFRQGFNEIIYAIQNKLGLAVLIGEVGTGKTTLARAILRELRNKCKTAYIINPSLSFEELVGAILRDFGEEDIPQGREALLARLNEFLLDSYHQGETVVVFIDEAHLLEEKELEKIRLLSNLETNKEKLLQIVLIGQPELGRTLSKRSMRQLRDRIVVQVGLEPLKPKEVCDYIYHRLSLAGDSGVLSFTPRACKKIAALSAGIPRRINMLCDRALLAAYAKRTFEITPKLVKVAAKDLNREFPQEVLKEKRKGIGWSGWVLIFTTLCIAGVFYINQTFFGYSPKELLKELLMVGKAVPEAIVNNKAQQEIKPALSQKAPEKVQEETSTSPPPTPKEKEPSKEEKEQPQPQKNALEPTSKPSFVPTTPQKIEESKKRPSTPPQKESAPSKESPTEGNKQTALTTKEAEEPPQKKKAQQEASKTPKVSTAPKANAQKPTAKMEKKPSAQKPQPQKSSIQKKKAQKASSEEPKAQQPNKPKEKHEKPAITEPILSPETEKTIEMEVERWKKAMENLDEATLKAMYSPSLYPQLEERLEVMRSGGEEREIRIENLKITPLVNGDIKVTFEQQYLSMRYSDYGLTTLVFRKKEKKWIIVGSQWKSL